MDEERKNFDFIGCKVLAAVFGAVILVAALLLIPVWRIVASGHKSAYERVMASQAAEASKLYLREFGVYPAGENVQILSALQGSNPRKIVFFEAPPKSFNAKGELIDFWGTPFRFDFSDPAKPRVWSCGKDRQDNGGAPGSDDLTSWQP